MIFCVFGISWVPHSILELLSSWSEWFGKGGNGRVWNIVPLCIMRCSWREQNAHHFEGQGLSMAKMKYFLLKSLSEWTKWSSMSSITGFLEFLDLMRSH